MTVETLHKDYSAREDEWQTCRDVLAGPRAVKAAGTRYLPALSGQQNKIVTGTGTTEYDHYKMRAKFYGATARTRDALVGTIFHKDIVVEGPAELLDQMKDVTLDDTPLEDFAVMALSEVVGLGRFGILVDMPSDEDPGAATRPYWVGYRTEQIPNWRTTTLDGDVLLTMVVLRECYEVDVNEFETKELEQYRVLRLLASPDVPEAEGGMAYTQTIYRKPTETSKVFVAGPTLMPLRRGKPLPFIPFQFIGPTTLGPTPEKPPLSDMAETNLHLYRRSADLEHGRHFTGLPTPVIIGMPPSAPGVERKPMAIGASEAWMLPPACDAKYLEFTGQGLSALVEGVAEDKSEMAELGSEMFAAEPDQGNSQETATAVRVRHSSKTASLKTIARRLGSGLSKCLRWHAWWLGATQDYNDAAIICKVNTVFLDLKMSPDEFKAWMLGLQSGAVSFKTFYAQLEAGELSRPGVSAEQEKAQIDAETPEPVVEPTPEPGQPAPKPGEPGVPAPAKKAA